MQMIPVASHAKKQTAFSAEISRSEGPGQVQL